MAQACGLVEDEPHAPRLIEPLTDDDAEQARHPHAQERHLGAEVLRWQYEVNGHLAVLELRRVEACGLGAFAQRVRIEKLKEAIHRGNDARLVVSLIVINLVTEPCNESVEIRGSAEQLDRLIQQFRVAHHRPHHLERPVRAVVQIGQRTW